MKNLAGWPAKLSIFSVILGLSLCLILGLGSSKVSASSLAGSGTSLDPYLITNCDQLATISLDLTAYYALDNDIDCSGHSDFTNAVITGSFSGTLDGQTHKVTGLKITASSTNDLGLFSILDGATIKNLFIDGDVTGHRNVGILAGDMINGASANKVIIFGLLHCTNENCGGITGALKDDSSISNSGVIATITDDGQSSGGLVGWIANNGTIDLSYASGTISGTNYVGGLVGAVNNAPSIAVITDSYSDATVTGSEWIGGLVGLGTKLNLYSSYASGTVTGTDSVGGLVGVFFGDMAEVFSAAEVHGTGGAVGPVTGHFAGGTVGNRYFDTERTGFSSSPDGSSPIDTSVSANYFIENHTNPPMSTWTFNGTHWRTNFNTYPSLAPLFDPIMLCEAPESTNTTIHGTCSYIPLGWGTPTWEARWSLHNQNKWNTITDIDDIRFGDATVTGLIPGTEYDLEFRFTNDFGTSSWGKQIILTTGTAPSGGKGGGSTTVAQTTDSTYEAPKKTVAKPVTEVEETGPVDDTASFVSENMLPTNTVGTSKQDAQMFWGKAFITLGFVVGLLGALIGAKIY